MVMVVPLLTLKSTTAAATNCFNATLNDTVQRSDGCVMARIHELEELDGVAHVHLLIGSTVFCKMGTHCFYPFQDRLYSKDEDCVIPVDYLSRLDHRKEYIICGRFVDDEQYDTALTGKPLLYNKELRKEVASLYASSMKLSQPQVNVKGHWQRDTQIDPVIYYVREGSSVTLKCFYPADVSPRKLRMTWNNDSLTEDDTHKLTVMYHSEQKDVHYEINAATFADSGIYRCQARLYQQYSVAVPLNLTVIARDAVYLTTSIRDPNVTEPADENYPVEWTVRFTAHPAPDFKWKKQGVLLRDSQTNTSREQYRNHEMRVILEDGLVFLYLYHPSVIDNGEYTLEASLQGTDITTTTTMHLIMPGKPQNVQLSSSSESGDFGFTCTAEGFPKPNLTLLFTADEANNTSEATEVSSILEQVMEESSADEDDKASIIVREAHWSIVVKGWYQCVAVNELGTASSPRQLFSMDEDSPNSQGITIVVVVVIVVTVILVVLLVFFGRRFYLRRRDNLHLHLRETSNEGETDSLETR